MKSSAAVLDASIAAPWFLPDDAEDASDHAYAMVRRGTLSLHAPDLWLWECGNIVASAVKRRRLSIDDAKLAWSALEAIRPRITLQPQETGHVSSALKLALDHRLSIYDAAYLLLASSLSLPLLTADRALRRAAKAHGVATLSIRDLA